MDPWNRATPYASSNGSRYGTSVSNIGASSGSRYGNSVSTCGASSGSRYGNSVSNFGASSGSRYGNSVSNFGASSGSKYKNSVSNFEASSGSRYGNSMSTFGASGGSKYRNSVFNFGASSVSRSGNSVSNFGASSVSTSGNSVSNFGASSGSRYGNSVSNFGASSGSRYGNSVSNFEASNGSGYGNSVSNFGASSSSRYGTSVSNFGASSGSRYGTSVSIFGASSGSGYGNSVSNFEVSNGSTYGNSVSIFGASSGSRYGNSVSNFEASNGSIYGNSVSNFGAFSGSRYGNSVSNFGASSGSRYRNSVSNFGASTGSRYGNSVANVVGSSGSRFENPLSKFETPNRKDTHKKNKCKGKKRNKSSSGLSSDCVRESELRGRDSFSHQNHNSVVVTTEVEDFSHKDNNSVVVKTEMEDAFFHIDYRSVVVKTEVEDDFAYKGQNSVVVTTEVEESSDFEELFDYEAETQSGKRDLSPDWEHIVQSQYKKQNVNSDRMQLDCAREQINGNEASKKQKKSKKQLNTLNIMILEKPMASKLIDNDGVNFLQTLGEETNLRIRVKKQKIKGNMRYVCVFYGASDRKAEAQEAVERFLHPIRTRQIIKAIPFKSDCSFANLRENLEIVDSSERYWAHLASLRYKIVRKKEKLLIKFGNNNKLVKQWHQNYCVLNAMILGKLDVADGPKHMQILRQWLQENNESSPMTSTIAFSFNYVFNYGVALDIDYSEVIKRFRNGEKLQEKIVIKVMLESGVTMCNVGGWTEDLKYLKSLYEKIIISNYSTDSMEQFKKNHAQLKAKRGARELR